MTGWVAEKQPISPSRWVDAAAKLNLFIGDENNRLYDLESELAKKKLPLLEEMTVAKANATIEATEEYKEYRKQGAYIKQIQEFVRIAKKQATMSEMEFKGY